MKFEYVVFCKNWVTLKVVNNGNSLGIFDSMVILKDMLLGATVHQ